MGHGRPQQATSGARLRSARLAKGFTLRGLATQCTKFGRPVSDSQLSRIERDRNRPRPKLLVTLARVLEVQVADLLHEDAA